MEEFWKDIEGYEGFYQISNLGRVKSLERANAGNATLKTKLLKLSIDGAGYYQVSLCRDRVREMGKAHKLVAKAFIPNPDNKPWVKHKDGNKLNNSVDNLEWRARPVGQKRIVRKGFKVTLPGENNGNAKLKNTDIPIIRKMLSEGYPQTAVAKFFNVDRSTIGTIKRGEGWTSIPESA